VDTNSRPFLELRCVCLDQPLSSLLQLARLRGWTRAGQVADGTGCGGQCTSCRPYIARMLHTGMVPGLADLMDVAERERWSRMP
jgi:bacterioferritin-associated ferredoxin